MGRGGLAGAWTAVATLALCSSAWGAESGFGAYLLGSRGILAGIEPPPGLYFASASFFYSGEFSGEVSLAPGGATEAQLSVDLAFDLLTPIWITPLEIAGGKLGFAATLPVGYVGVGLSTASGTVSDSRTTYGDPSLAAFVGWHQDDFHWNVGASYYLPVGSYESRLANLALHREAIDLFASGTWLETTRGLTATVSGGVTFNEENERTDYRTGTEFHVEGGVTKALGKGLSAGLFAYHYTQLTSDSGSGAALPFEGRASAIGAVLGYDFEIERTTISARLQVMKEFDVENRFEGAPVFLSIFVSPPQ